MGLFTADRSDEPVAEFSWVRIDDNHLSSVMIDAGLLHSMSLEGDKLGVAAILRARQMTADVVSGREVARVCPTSSS